MSVARLTALSRVRRRRGGRIDRGASAVEYALLVAGIVLALLIILPSLGDILELMFQDQCEGLADGTPSSDCN